MRRLLFSAALSALLAAGALAQEPTGSEGSLFLLLPTGAQAVGLGQAMVAAKPGSEGIWWNPASLAEQDKRELAIHHSQTVAGTGDALTYVLPTRSFGTAALSVNLLNLGDQDVTDVNGDVVGRIIPRDVVLAGTYAANVTKRLTAGLNYKVVQIRVDCSGECSSVGAEVRSSRAMDFGAQYDMHAGAPLTLGIAIRNLGGKINSRDTNQRDPLPTQVEVGAMYRLRFIDHYVKDTELRALGSFINTRTFGGKSVRFGTDVMYQGKVHLRAGYVGHDRRGSTSAALGFGLQNGGFAFDIARTFGGLPAESGQSPVYVSLRYLF
ncbi:MAG TPA: PorV/PorQ family protein [Gemmatimonadaceae bacterium]|nr:PorV/PorQ family protein [Gemmatimonadaceae bacterium]